MLIFSVSSLIKTWRSHLWLLNQSTIKGIFIKKYIFLPVFIVSQFLSATPEDRVYIENIVEKSPDAQQFVKENPERYEAILKIINLPEGKLDKNPVEAQFKKAINNCETKGEFEAKSACVLRPKNIGPEVKNVFFVGLAADFCVLDSAINAKMANPKLDVHIIYDLTRYAWLSPEQKSYGRGPDFASGRFITDISEIANKYRELDIKLVHSTDLKILKV